MNAYRYAAFGLIDDPVGGLDRISVRFFILATRLVFSWKCILLLDFRRLLRKGTLVATGSTAIPCSGGNSQAMDQAGLHERVVVPRPGMTGTPPVALDMCVLANFF